MASADTGFCRRSQVGFPRRSRTRTGPDSALRSPFLAAYRRGAVNGACGANVARYRNSGVCSGVAVMIESACRARTSVE
jgi:hypothetical protein